MNRYIIKFSKEGVICYISHLDTLRLFKRAFKREGICLSYSKGFNPHPKMGFAQPLPLGYSSVSEYLEFETDIPYQPQELAKALRRQLPEGIRIFSCEKGDDSKKSLAARTTAAEYIIAIPAGESTPRTSAADLCEDFLKQKEIRVPKRQKKSKEMKDINIRDKIRSMNIVSVGENLLVTALLDSGSDSNLSPELLITALVRFWGLPDERSDISVMRTKLSFL